MVGDGTTQSQRGEGRNVGAPIVLAREQVFRIGEIEFRPATREVCFAGQTSIIEPRVMQFVIALHRARGAVVSKDDLIQSCWGGRIVGDDAINRAVSRLRSVAEKADRGFRIETITKVGYRLVSTDGKDLDAASEEAFPTKQPGNRVALSIRLPVAIAAIALLMLVTATGAWLWLRPAPAAAHSMMVRLTGYRALSADLPPTMHESINAEITAAFNVDGVIGVSTLPTPKPGIAPAYLLDGAIYRVGGSIRVISQLTNERSGVVLWSESADYTADQASKIPHKIAVDVGTVVRCGLSGAATYRTSLPDLVLSNYMQYCREYWSYGGTKTLHLARRVVAELPDFSWGWSAVANGYMQASQLERDSQRAEALRTAGRHAEDKALALDRNNSEALAHKAYLIDRRDWVGQEALFKSAIAAKPLDCGCEHYGYGLKLESVGRLGAAAEQFRAATDMLALWPDSQVALARVLVAIDRRDQARPYFDAAIDLSSDPHFDKKVAVIGGVESGDYTAAMSALRSPQFQMTPEIRAALLAGYEALASRAPKAKQEAVQGLLALPKDQRSDTVALMLGALGANREALQVAAEKPWLFWRRSMRGVPSQPEFQAVATELGLMTYWRTSHTKPDVCMTKDAATFCGSI